MRKVFMIIGAIWSDIGKANTDLNCMLSSPLFRHKNDVDFNKLHENSDGAESVSIQESSPRGVVDG